MMYIYLYLQFCTKKRFIKNERRNETKISKKSYFYF